MILFIAGYSDYKGQKGLDIFSKVVIKPQVGAVRAAAVDVCARDDESAEFGAGIAVVAPEDVGTDFHVQVLSNIPDRPGLQNSGRVFEVVDAR